MGRFRFVLEQLTHYPEVIDYIGRNGLRNVDGGLSGYRNLHEDLTAAWVDCGRDWVLRLMREAGISAQRGNKCPKGY